MTDFGIMQELHGQLEIPLSIIGIGPNLEAGSRNHMNVYIS